MGKMKNDTLRKIQIFWSVFIGAGAFLGGAMMFISPSGEMFGMDPMLPLLRRLPFPEIFFNDFIWSGIALIAANGITNVVAFVMLMRRSKYGSLASAVCGIVLMLWIVLQFIVFPINFMSSIYFLFGILQATGGLMLYRRESFKNKRYENRNQR